MTVEYRTITRFPGYRFGSDGIVWSSFRVGGQGSKASWRKMKTHFNKGYLRLSLQSNGRGVFIRVHRIICEAFHGPMPQTMELCRHLNDLKTDNRQQNLAWGTYIDNFKDLIRNEIVRKNVKLTESQVIEMRAIRKHTSLTNRKMASVYGVDHRVIGKTCHYEMWKHIK